MHSNQPSIHRCNASTTPSGQLGKPRIGYLPMTRQTVPLDFNVAVTIIPKFVVRHQMDEPQRSPSGGGRAIRGRHHMHSQQSAFGDGTGCKTSGLAIKPVQRPAMMHMLFKRQGSEHIAIEEPDHTSINQALALILQLGDILGRNHLATFYQRKPNLIRGVRGSRTIVQTKSRPNHKFASGPSNRTLLLIGKCLGDGKGFIIELNNN